MSNPDLHSYAEFWPHYVRAHRKQATRIVHAVGTTAALACVVAFVATRKKVFLSAAPVAGYGPAWISHFFIEGNMPATFKYPLWSLRGDLEMFARTITGTMDQEVERCCREPVTPTDSASSEAPPTADASLN